MFMNQLLVQTWLRTLKSLILLICHVHHLSISGANMIYLNDPDSIRLQYSIKIQVFILPKDSTVVNFFKVTYLLAFIKIGIYFMERYSKLIYIPTECMSQFLQQSHKIQPGNSSRNV